VEKTASANYTESLIMERIPLTIMAGSDHAPGHLPESSANLHSLSTVYKGAEVKVGDTPLIALMIEQIEKSRGFGPITIAGPADIYAPLELEATLVDTNGSVATNLKAALDHHLETHPHKPIALLAYDVLMTSDELDALSARYQEDEPCAVWVPLVRKPDRDEELGAFGWKPTYRLSPAKGAAPLNILPGHLGILQLEAMRLPILYELLNLAYATRNHPVPTRKKVMVRSVIGQLLRDDLRALCSFRMPRLTGSVITNGLRIARQLRKGDLTIPDLEDAIGGIFLRHDSPLKKSGRGVRHPIVDILRLAEDIDTQEEAAHLEHQPGSCSGKPGESRPS